MITQFKYTYTLDITTFPDGTRQKEIELHDRSTTVPFINTTYIPYYIQEIQKLLDGKRYSFEIHITDDENYDAPDDWSVITKEWSYGQSYPEYRIETEQLLEFFKIMKKELGIGDEIVVDERCNPAYYNTHTRITGIHHRPMDISGVTITDKTEEDVNGVYKAKVFVNGIPKTTCNGYSTFFPDSWTKQQVADAVNEAFANRVLQPGSNNTYIGKLANGMPIQMYIQNDLIFPDPIKIRSAFPIYTQQTMEHPVVTTAQLKYTYTVDINRFPDGRIEKQIKLHDRPTTVPFINATYIPYYIQEIQKLLDGKRYSFEIHITDDENYDAPDDWSVITKEWSYGQSYPEYRIETEQLLEFFKIMKKELGIGDEIVVDSQI